MPESVNLLSDWQLIIAVATALGAVAGYFITHHRELSWKRTEFVCSQLKYLSDDPNLFQMLELLEGRHPEVSIGEIYDASSTLDSKVRAKYQHEFDRFLNFIWCLCFAYLNLKTLTSREIVCIGRYLYLIKQHPALVAYCNEHGYKRIIIVADRLGYENAYNT